VPTAVAAKTRPPGLLEAEGFTCWLLNARHVKNVPGRPKTDKLDAVWLAKVVERGRCRPSFVPPAPIRRLRDLTRYRRTLIRERTREKQRVEKLLEDAQIKLSSVASDIFGVSGRHMLQAMIAGQRDPKVLAQLARASMRAKLRQLEEALTGHFDDHHGFLCRMMLERIDELTARIDEQAAPVRGPGRPAGCGDRHRTGLRPRAHRASSGWTWPSSRPPRTWRRGPSSLPRPTPPPAKPRRRPPAGATRGWPPPSPEVAVTAGRTSTFLGERYRRIAKRRGKQRALVAVGNSVLTIIWHLLADPQARYCDLGPDFYPSRSGRHRQERNLIRQLQQLTGKTVTLTPRPATPAA
jgi:hypothetical protein